MDASIWQPHLQRYTHTHIHMCLYIHITRTHRHTQRTCLQRDAECYLKAESKDWFPVLSIVSLNSRLSCCDSKGRGKTMIDIVRANSVHILNLGVAIRDSKSYGKRCIISFLYHCDKHWQNQQDKTRLAWNWALSLREYNPSQQRRNSGKNQATAQVALLQSARKQKTRRRAGSKPWGPPPIGSLPLHPEHPIPTVPPAGEATVQTWADGDILHSLHSTYSAAPGSQNVAKCPKKSKGSCEKSPFLHCAVLSAQLTSPFPVHFWRGITKESKLCRQHF